MGAFQLSPPIFRLVVGAFQLIFCHFFRSLTANLGQFFHFSQWGELVSLKMYVTI